MVHENPVIALVGDQTAFHRSHRYVKEGKKKVAMIKPVTTAQQAINRDLPQTWDTPGTQYPLVLDRGQGILLLDLDHIAQAIADELIERVPTYWDRSCSGKGFHGYAVTDLTHIRGRKKIFYDLGDQGKIEIFFGCQPAILTNQHIALRPLVNCDRELRQLLPDFDATYGRGHPLNIPSEKSGGVGHIVLRLDSFSSWVTLHSLTCTGSYPSATKRRILEYLWNAPKYDCYSLRQPFCGQSYAQYHGMTRQQVSKHLLELEKHGWLVITHKVYPSGYAKVTVELNVEDQFLRRD